MKALNPMGGAFDSLCVPSRPLWLKTLSPNQAHRIRHSATAATWPAAFFFHFVAFTRSQKQIFFQTMLPRIEIVIAALQAPTVQRAFRAPRSSLTPRPESGRPGESLTGGARSQKLSCPASGISDPAESMPLTLNPGSTWLHPGSEFWDRPARRAQSIRADAVRRKALHRARQ